MLIGLKQKDLKNKLEQKLDELYEIRKNTVYINGTGNYGDNYKKRLIKSFNLDKKFANIVMSLSYGTVRELTKELNIEELINE